MTDREKLVELIYESGQLGVFASYDREMETCERFADYLISKGAAIPVMCENCKHFEQIGESLPYDVGLCCRDNSYWFPWDFCSYGERKEE